MIALALAALGLAPPAPEAPVGFRRDVLPVLVERCFTCHGERKKSGKYDMSRPERLLAGGASGGPVTPGDSEESEFYTLIVTGEARAMPPRHKADRVPAADAEVVRRWIQQGAKFDGLAPDADLLATWRADRPAASPARPLRPAPIRALAFTPDGNRLVLGGAGELTVWNLDGDLIGRVRTRAERTTALVFLPDGTLVAAGGKPGVVGTVTAYRLDKIPAKRGKEIVELDGLADPAVKLADLVTAFDLVLDVAVTPDGKLLASAGCDRQARVFDLSAGVKSAKLVKTIESHADWVLGVALSADGKTLATASRDKTARLTDIATGEIAQTFAGHNAPVFAVAFAPGGAVLSAGRDDRVRAWPATGEPKQTAEAGGHNGEVTKFAVSASGPFAATGGADRTVRLMKSPKLEGVHHLKGLTEGVTALAISPDGKWLAAADGAGRVRAWKTETGNSAPAFLAVPGAARGR